VIRLMVCDDHALMRAGLVAALKSDDRFSVVAEAETRADLLRWLDDGPEADTLLLDLSIDAAGVKAGIDLIETVRLAKPTVPVIVVSMHREAELVGHALHAGAKAYVTKDSSLQELVDAILQVQRGHHYLAPSLVEPIVRHQQAAADGWDAALTPREREVLQLICSGKRLSEIAAAWGVSIKTVSTHKVRLMEKLGVTSNAELIKLGVRRGLV
jgi:DNA-binding NarL/FixJ family response regulator